MKLNAQALARSSIVFPLALSALTLACNALWLYLDQTPLSWDSAGHYSQILVYRDIFHHLGASGFGAILDADIYYPPLAKMVVAALMVSAPATADMAVWLCSLIFLPVLLLSIFQIGLLAFDRRTACFAAAWTALHMQVLYASRTCMLDLPLASVTALAALAMIRAVQHRTLYTALLSGAVLSLGMLTKWTFLAFMVLPVGLFWLVMSRDLVRQRGTRFVFLLAGSLWIGWYARHSPTIAGQFISSYQDHVTSQPRDWTATTTIITMKHLGLLPLLAVVMGLFLCRLRLRKGDIALWLLLLALVGGYAIHLPMRKLYPRFILPALTLALLFAGHALAHLSRSRATRMIPVVILLLAAAHTGIGSWLCGPYTSRATELLAMTLGYEDSEDNAVTYDPESKWPIQEIADAIDRAVPDRDVSCIRVLINQRYLNSEVVRAALLERGCRVNDPALYMDRLPGRVLSVTAHAVLMEDHDVTVGAAHKTRETFLLPDGSRAVLAVRSDGVRNESAGKQHGIMVPLCSQLILEDIRLVRGQKQGLKIECLLARTYEVGQADQRLVFTEARSAWTQAAFGRRQPGSYRVYLRLTGKEGTQTYAQWPGYGHRPTSLWSPGEAYRVTFRTDWPADIEEATEIQLAVSDAPFGLRVTLAGEESSYPPQDLLSKIEIGRRRWSLWWTQDQDAVAFHTIPLPEESQP